MSGRSKEAAADGQGAERRSTAGHRVHFEALVAVGGLEGGAGFEAESVDVSADGMRFRTAYLPVVGDKLVCRFDGLDGEVIVEGEVIWATEQQKGGEFAVRFLGLDDETREMLKQLCVLEDADEAASPKREPESLAGTRVKLHIEGLGSPMKARVRSGNERELAVGSSLEFLKLGRTVELEDVDRNKRRDGYVDSVKVEIDPATSVPQLVVSLRFDGVAPAMKLGPKGEAQMVIEPSPKTKPGLGPNSEAQRTDVTVRAAASAANKTDAAKASRVQSDDAPGTVRAADGISDPDAEIDEELDFGKSKLRVASDKAKEMTTAAVGKIGPALNGFGASAKNVWAKVGDGLAKRREKRAEDAKANAPRRVTSPAPGGALKAAGRKLVREEESPDSDNLEIPKRNHRKAVLGAVLGLGIVVGIFGVVRATTGGSETAKKPAALAAETRAADQAPAIPPIPNAPATGDVPLFGATPLSTTEQIPASPAPAGSGKARADESDGEGDAKDAKAPTAREWGEGDVSNAKVLKIQMDGPIAGISGEANEHGFTVKVPGRKSIRSSSSLAHKDKRLSAVDVTNREDAAEVSLTFKGDVPAYLAKVKGDRLEIQIGGEPKKVASKAGKKKAGSKKKGH